MCRAGLNPMLAFMKGGASTPSGSMPQGQSPGRAGLEAFDRSRQTSASNRLADAQIENVNSASQLTRAKTAMVRAQTPKQSLLGDLWKKGGETLNSASQKYNLSEGFTPGKSHLDKKVIEMFNSGRNSAKATISERIQKLHELKNYLDGMLQGNPSKYKGSKQW